MRSSSCSCGVEACTPSAASASRAGRRAKSGVGRNTRFQLHATVQSFDTAQQAMAVRIFHAQPTVGDPLAVHEIGEPHPTRGSFEVGLQDCRAVQVAARHPVLACRADPQESAPVGVQQAAEHRATVEMRQAAPVNRAVRAHLRRGMRVADQCVVEGGAEFRNRYRHFRPSGFRPF